MATRIIVKNLAPNLTQTRLKTHFSAQQSGTEGFSGVVTDAKLVTDAKTGKSRGFAFIGYRTQEEALRAVEWFNGTFIDMRKIIVEIAKPAGDESLGQSWREKNREYLARKKETAKNEDKEDNMSKKRKRETGDEGGKDDVIKELTQSKRKNKLLAQNPDLEKAQKETKSKKAVAVEEEKPKKKKKKEVEKRVEVIEPTNVVEVVYDDSAPQPDDDTQVVEEKPMTDLEWLRSRTSRTFGLVSDSEKSDTEQKKEEKDDSSDDEDEESDVLTPATPPATEPSDIEEEEEAPAPKTSTAETKILKTGRLFVRNLVYGVTEDDLRGIFSPFGEIEEIHIPLGSNHEPLPIAFILFTNPSDAVRAFKALDGKDLQGRLMHIIPGDQKRVSQEDDLEGKTLKQRREIERRKQAGRGIDWGTLFMNQDAVLSSLAARYGVTKSDLLLDSSSTTDPAIKSAMAETTILTETKSYLLDHGINLSSLTTPTKQRSDTVIIAKNFPYGTTESELVHLFGGGEIVKRILLPPAGTIAFLEFFDAGQARTAFKRLAYRRFKDVPLYLEKAPQSIFTVEPTTKLGGIQAKPASSDLLTADVEEEPGSTLYVKNLDFSTTQSGLTDAFKHFPGFRVALLKMKPANAKGERLSMGFGFVTFASKEMASAAMNAGVILDGRKLEIKFARQGAGTEVKAVKGAKSSAGQKKLVVKNLGFNVNKRDIRELFGTYGHIQSLRLPKKFDNSTRGFAFIEFTTASDARNAMESLKHTHLLGRHLVIEWAEEEDLGAAVEKTRGKVREGVEAGEVGRMMGFDPGSGGRVVNALDEGDGDMEM